MEFRTSVAVDSAGFYINYDSRLMLMGSCFAENIGRNLEYFRFKTDINPFGIVYNPLSVANVLKFLLEKKVFREEDLWQNAGKWVSLYHHGSFSSAKKEVCLSAINERLAASAERLRQTDVLWITFGTAWVYRHRASGVIVGNCHKFPAADFERFRLSVEDILTVWQPLIKALQAVNPDLKIVFTVSPVRHWKDGAHGNQLSKAVLLLAAEALTACGEDLYYFPSYEIVMDELRDYRFYAPDMLHVSEQAVDYLWEKFRQTFCAPEMLPVLERVEKINKKLLHRPFDPESEAYRTFCEGIQREIEELQRSGQNVDFSSSVS